MQEIFEANKSEKLQGVIVWLPMLATDSIDAANERESKFLDSRVKQFWDEHRIVGRIISQTLKLKGSTAWDVYLIYPPDHAWDTELPPRPIFWMHQLDDEPTLLLDPPRLREYVKTVLERTFFP